MRRLLAVLLLCLSTSVPASNNVKGYFKAALSCPGYISKNKLTNPDNLFTRPDQIYPLKEVNNFDNPTWLRVIISESTTQVLRWVSVDCGTVDFEKTEAATCEQIAGLADSYVLALSWQPAFCETYGYDAGKPECLHLPEQSWQASHLVLHGLWPNQDSCGEHYGFCGVPQASKHCDYAPVQLNEQVAKQLRVFMPAFAFGSCLERHEWNKHGSCQKLSSDDYFAKALRLTEEADQTMLGTYLQEHRGQVVARADLRSILRQAFGEEADRNVYLGCKKGYLVDIFIDLPAQIPTNQSINELIKKAPGFSRQDGCPERVAISDFSH